MARPIYCDFDEGEPSPAAFMLSVLDTGEQQAFCAGHVPLLAQGLLASAGIPLVTGEPEPTSEAGAGEAGATAPARPRKRRGRVAVGDDGAGPAVAPQEGDTGAAG